MHPSHDGVINRNGRWRIKREGRFFFSAGNGWLECLGRRGIVNMMRPYPIQQSILVESFEGFDQRKQIFQVHSQECRWTVEYTLGLGAEKERRSRAKLLDVGGVFRSVEMRRT